VSDTGYTVLKLKIYMKVGRNKCFARILKVGA